jgi:hypothetical protein
MNGGPVANGDVPVDYLTSVGQVRLLVPDTAVGDDGDYLFSDDQITALLLLFSDNVRRAAAQAKDIIASDMVMLLKVVRTDDLSVDGAKVAAELRLQAKQLRDQADSDDQSGLADLFTIVYPGGDCYPEGVPVWGRHLVELGPC